MPEKNKPSLLLTLGASGLLIGGGIAAYWVLSQYNGSSELPVGANVVPQDALLTVSLSTDAAQWQQLRQFGTAQTQAELEKNLTQLRDRFLTNNGYNYAQDVQPWVGKEVTIAFLPPATATSNSQQSMLIVLPIANQAAAQQTLAASPQSKWVTRNYKGIQIQETQGSAAGNYSFTVLDQLVAISDDPRATESAIDTYQSGASIAKIPGYTNAIAKIVQPNRLAQAYLNIPIAAQATSSTQSPIPQGLAQLQENQGLATTITLEPEGLRFQSISWLKPNSQRVYTVENNSSQMQRRLPAETLMMISGANLQRLWQDYVVSSQANPLAPFPPENLRAGFKSLTGLDLDRDLLSWMNNEFAVAVIPGAAKTDTPQDFALSLALVARTSDRTIARKSFQQLTQVLQSRYQFKIQETQLNGETVTNWIAPFGTLTATQGWLDRDVAFVTLGAPVANRFVPNPPTSLSSTAQFQKSVPTALNPYNGQFFLDINPTVKALPLPQFLPGQRMILEATRSIGGTAAVSDARSIRYDFFMSLEKQSDSTQGKI